MDKFAINLRRKDTMPTVRHFLRIISLIILGFYMSTWSLCGRFVFAQLPTIVDPLFTQPILDPAAIPKYVTPLPNPLNPGFILVPDTTTYPGFDFYNVSQRQITSQVLPAGFPATAVWAYGDPGNAATFSYPGHTIVARSMFGPVNESGLGKPVKVQYDNELPDTHLLPVDKHIHGTEDGEPEVRTIVHLHGGKNVGPESDGYPEAWVTPDGMTIEDFPSAIPSNPYTPFNPNPFDYHNDQKAATLWFHDHALGITRLNVYAGLAAFYILHDDNEDALVAGGFLPAFPHEIPVVIQDRMFYPDGSLAYPDTAAGMPPVQPSIQPEFFGEVVVVNGVTWPYLNVEPRKYRIRFLNGSNSRFYKLFFSSGQPFHVIGMEGGFLNAPVMVDQLVLSPAERADCIIDFAPFAGQTITLRNNAKSPFPKGTPVNPKTVGQIMQFRVITPLSGMPDTTLPANLNPVGGDLPPVVVPIGTPTRQLILFEGIDGFGRLQPLLGTPTSGGINWFSPITENPAVGATEVWEVYNTTPDAHPIHIHEILFRTISRQKFRATQNPVTGALTNVRLQGRPKPPAVFESGFKDTVIMYPGEVTRILATFEASGLFVWHCHILEHEDHEMMRPYLIGQ
ncbi:MAG: multicopper oxidase family protein [Candidatus Loosdrechtia sp.]|uniref:multicopper oxidase family protein n=1 Tax=Candidatus Loosdrechtia sp. TaxID=3101272 RepID=UPI003A5E6C6B|nr:MAG: multicopper oxidase [Candidatus Jettenia sp. AMX2]